MFDPAFAGYWGNAAVDRAMDLCLRVMENNAPRIDSIKISLLDAEAEKKMRRWLPAN